MDALDKVVKKVMQTLSDNKKRKPSQYKNRMRIDDIKEQRRLEKELQDYDFSD